MPTVRQRYEKFLRTEIVPALRNLGLRGGPTAFVLPDERSWALIGFDRSWKDARQGKARFTVNLTHVTKEAWEDNRSRLSWLPIRPTASSSAGFHWVEVIRLGQLLPEGGDRWWSLDGPQPDATIALEVVGAITDLGIPWLRSQIGAELTSGALRKVPGVDR